MYYQDVISEAIDTVLGWDLPEEELAAAFADRARLIAGTDSDDAIDHTTH